MLSFAFVTFQSCIIGFATSAKILALFPYPLKSHFIVFDALLIELANRGHNVTVFTAFPKENTVPNYHQVDTSHCLHVPDQVFTLDYAVNKLQSPFLLFRSMNYVTEAHDEILRCDQMQRLMRTTEAYDLMITELFACDALLAFGHQLRIPYIGFSSFSTLPWTCWRVGSIDNPSYISQTFTDYPQNSKSTSFFGRVYNALVYLAAKYHSEISWKPRTEEIIRKHFGPSIPSVDDLAKNTSLIFSFSHFSLNSPRPQVPAVIEVGGIHIKTASSLPKDLETFLNDSTNGVIYFSLGSLIQAKTMSPQIRDVFVNVFQQIMPYKVLWKWETDNFLNISTNIMTRKWIPQRDVLAHPNVRLFITHGGASSVNEAVFEGLPMLGIPIYADQFNYLNTIKSAGAGEIIRYAEISVDNLLKKIKTIIKDKTYVENAKQLSFIYKDRMMKPMESAVYWTEYTIRHKGAPHLRTAAVELTWYEYLLLDVISFLLMVAVVILVLAYKIVLFVLQRLKTKFYSKIKTKKKLTLIKLNS